MANKPITTAQTYTSLIPQDRILILDIAAGGNVKVEYSMGTKWITADTFTESGVKIVYVGGAELRITPSAGSSFALG